MAARPFDSTHGRVPGIHSLAATRAFARRHPLRYRLAIIGRDTADVAHSAGGWLFDRTMAGWDVTVLVAEPGDARPLQILGATPLDLQSALDSVSHGPVPQVIAVSADVFRSNNRIHDGLLDGLDTGDYEVRVWGKDLPAELVSRCAVMQHRLSVAARAFKSRAVIAASGPAAVADTVETFHGGVLATFPAGADLVPAS